MSTLRLHGCKLVMHCLGYTSLLALAERANVPSTLGAIVKHSLLQETAASHSSFHILANYRTFGTSQAEKFSTVCDTQQASAKVMRYLESLKNYEKEGLPKSAGTDTETGFDLGRMHRLLSRIGDPISYQVVHVAGTKGKGSTVAFLSNILRSAGYNVGAYTSPHLMCIRERIAAGRSEQPISDLALYSLFDELEGLITEVAVAEGGALSHFEVLTALAFAYFAKEKVDIAVIEAGLGGARDATNVVTANRLAAAVIVGIAEEHLEALGGSLETVAQAKAGIIKSGCPVVFGKQKETIAKDILHRVAASKNARVFPPAGLNFVSNGKGLRVSSSCAYQYCDFSIDLLAPNSDQIFKNEIWALKNVKLYALGAHQRENATTAILTALCLRNEGWKISDLSIRMGLERTRTPGRFQISTPDQANHLRANGCTIIFDGAHTRGSAAVLALTLREAYPEQTLAIVVAMASDKDHFGFASTILAEAMPDVVVTTTVMIDGSPQRATSADSLADNWIQAAKLLCLKVLPQRPNSSEGTYPHSCSGSLDEDQSYLKNKSFVLLKQDSVQNAIKEAAQALHDHSGDRTRVICVTGSFHTVSAALSLLSTPCNTYI